MVTTAAFASTAALVGEPARAAMLAALSDGRALTAGELARAASITPQTASGHLARLGAAGLLAIERQGRHRYHRLASPLVADMLEAIMAVAGAAASSARPVRTGPRDAAMREARTCYGHLAGRLAVGIADAMAAREWIELTPDGGAVTTQGEAALRTLGLALGASPGRRYCRPCLDWSERRPHLAGTVGKALCDHCLARGWVRRLPGSRTLLVPPEGRRAIRAAFGVV